MEQVSLTPAESARMSHALALQKIREVGQNEIAKSIGISPSTVSRDVNEDLERICQILATAGLKLVPEDELVVERHMFEAIATIAHSVLEDRKLAFKMVAGRRK